MGITKRWNRGDGVGMGGYGGCWGVHVGLGKDGCSVGVTIGALVGSDWVSLDGIIRWV